ncbi:MAG: biotin--[acetyl-CoA-carboxylase] ligase [Candidatus Saganbacteria bacterium]|nr:biotin--[acetyl-CoA-carboxylase] ligase [Candidatus Saganbacteria bacterium]
MKFNKLFYSEIDSTNEEARRLVKQGVQEGTVIVAESQTAGYGKWKRTWFSPKGDGLYVSIILFPTETFSPLEFSLLGTLASVKAIKTLTGLEARIKWPNDVMVNGKKIGGVLVEKVKEWIVIGIGLNVNVKTFPDELKENASSLYLQLGSEVNKEELLDLLLKELDQLYPSKEQICAEWKSLSDTLGKQVKVVNQQGSFQGKAIGYGFHGELILETSDGKIMEFRSADVF